jgi:cytochrome c peroxidase
MSKQTGATCFGATCPSDNVATLGAKRQASKLLLDKGLIRVGIPMPATNLQFAVTKVDDPYGCTNNPATGLTRDRRDRIHVPAAAALDQPGIPHRDHLGWTRTRSRTQSVDATRGHAQADADPSPEQQAQIVAFETGVFTAQVFDNQAHVLHEAANDWRVR